MREIILCMIANLLLRRWIYQRSIQNFCIYVLCIDEGNYIVHDCEFVAQTLNISTEYLEFLYICTLYRWCCSDAGRKSQQLIYHSICIVLHCVAAVCCSVLQCVAVCCSVLQCVAVCCSVLLCVAVCCTATFSRVSLLLNLRYEVTKKLAVQFFWMLRVMTEFLRRR